MTRMTRQDRALWRAAATLDELGELTAQWLEGSLASQPGYLANCGPDEETTELVPTLAAANRAGWLTDSSQPGWGPGLGYDSAVWCQRAAVEGYAAPELAGQVAAAAKAAGLLVVTHPRASRFPRLRDGVAVTTRAGRPVTGFGHRRTYRSLAFQYAECSDTAVAAVCEAVQLTVIDPDWGPRDRLWAVLDQITGRPTDQLDVAGEPRSVP